MKRKLLAMLLCVVLAVGLFGTLAVAAEENVAKPTPEAPVCDCGTETETHAETCALNAAPKAATETPVCNCEPQDGTHAATCPCYVAPKAEVEPPVCNCEPQDGTHAETCPCYVAPAPVAPAPETPAPQQNPDHLDTCSEDCTREDCTCLCHLVEKLVACETLEEFCTLLAQMTEEQLLSLSAEQYGKIEARLTELCAALAATLQPVEPEPVASVPAGDSEVVTPTVNFTNVAPLGAPVTG